jgi:bifunctional enzyme CysN/CysC
VARLVEGKLRDLGKHPYVIDGDIMRKGLSKDLGFDEKSRVENIRRAAEVASMMVDAGLIVLAAFISPFASERAMARTLVGRDQFIEVFMDTPLEIAEKRDPKSLYRRARMGEIKNFTGIDSPYEPPENPEVRLIAESETAEEMAGRVVAKILSIQSS